MIKIIGGCIIYTIASEGLCNDSVNEVRRRKVPSLSAQGTLDAIEV